jgi:hypothetical protein
MGSHVALVKGNRQMEFQVNRATHIFSSNLMRSPDGISCGFGLRKSPDGVSG